MPDSGPKIKPSPVLAGFRAYGPQKAKAPVDLYLDTNEGQPPSETLIDGVVREGTELIRRYPNARRLEGQIAARLGITEEQVVVTAGADDAIDRAMRSVLTSDREIIIPVPTFEMVERFAALTGCTIMEVPWLKDRFPTDAVLDVVSERTAMITVVSPNNPTGLTVREEDLRRISGEAPTVLILLDLVYTEFADRDLTDCALTLPNVVVIRSLSKSWGLAGLRVGYAAGPRYIIDWLRLVSQSYSVSSPSLIMASAALESGSVRMTRFAARVREERRAMTALLNGLEIETCPSQGNFVLARFADAGWMHAALAGLRISVRVFPGRAYLENAVRISLPGNEADFDRLTHALKTILKPEAVLFDMDGILADVTDSYHQAILATAEAFGVEITRDNIIRAKVEGNANNDWELTWHFIKDGGGDFSLEQVTDKFEELYQGKPGAPGLCTGEKLLVERSVLERLSSRVKLGVVTGRPRKDALTFLEGKGIDDLFSVVAAMEDGPLKPDPAPVRAAIERLAVERAWLLGDTADDIVAARAADVLPIGVVAPAGDPDLATEVLTKAGAARVLPSASLIEEYLP